MTPQINGTGLQLETLSESGAPPKSRLSGHKETQDVVAQLVRADDSRNRIRAKVKGLVDGVPPFSAEKLRAQGQGDRTNVNFREAEGFLALALSAFYDLFSEAPTYALVRADEGTPEEVERYSDILTEEFDDLQKSDETFDSLIQMSHHEMVMFATGPVMWEDDENWKAVSIKSGNLLLPDRTMSNLAEWPLAVIRASYQVDKLFRFIENASEAATMGWKVDQVRAAILGAMPDNLLKDGKDWEFQQQRIRNNDLYYSAQCDVVRCAHVLVKEFDGRITHSIVLENESDKVTDFLFHKVGRFEKWQQVIAPFYYDKGDGYHHSVKGLGVKMYAGLELKNRLKCATVDGAFARTQVMLQPTTTSTEQVAPVVQMGPYAYLPANHQVIQHNIAGVLDAPMEVDRELENVLQSNLSQYRQRIDKPQGNPRTAFEVSAIVSQQASLGKTQISRYCAQLDDFYAERYRRVATGNSKEAKDFRSRCEKRGVPEKCISKVKWVKATRVVGQGSALLRMQVLGEVLSIIGMLPEAGRQALLRDWVASRVGQEKATLYVPQLKASPAMQDQKSYAMLEDAAMKEGAPVMRTPTQDDLVHAADHLEASAGALQSLEQGADPMTVLAFVDMAGAHVAVHLQSLAGDKARQEEYKSLTGIWKQLAKRADELRKVVSARMEEQQKQQQQVAAARAEAEAVSNGQNIKAAQAKQDMAIKDAKARQAIRLKEEKANADLAIKDAHAAEEFSAR